MATLSKKLRKSPSGWGLFPKTTVFVKRRQNFSFEFKPLLNQNPITRLLSPKIKEIAQPPPIFLAENRYATFIQKLQKSSSWGQVLALSSTLLLSKI